MIRKLFTGQINSITVAALLIALSSLVSRLLGIFRDRVLASEFGAGSTLDIYYAAFRIPDLIFNLLVLGALSAGFIPILTQMIKSYSPEKEKENDRVWRFASNVLNIIALSVMVISVLGVLAAPWLMRLIAPGFGEEQLADAIVLTRIMFLSPIFLSLSSVFGGILQSFRRFFVYSLSPILYNIGIIIGALYFVPYFGIYGLAWGVVLGAFLHMAVQVPNLLTLKYKYHPVIDLFDSEIRKMLVMMIPRTITLAVSQVNLLVVTVIASTLVSGSLTVFNLANNLQSFPIGIFGISFAVAAFPTLASVAFDRKKLIRNFSAIFRQILFFIVPSTVLLLTLRAQVIRVILGTGQFGWEDTIMTIDTLGFFAFSLFAQASLPLLVRVFYARHNSKTPFLAGLVSVLVNIVFSWWLSGLMGVAGLALAFSIASIVNFILLWIILRNELGNMDELRILTSAVKFSAAALGAGITVQAMKLIVWPYIDMTKVWGVFTQGFAAGISGILMYLAICYFLRSEELSSLISSVKKKLPWKKMPTGDQGEARGI